MDWGRGCRRFSGIGGSQKLAGNVIKKIRLSGSPNLTLSVVTVAVLELFAENSELGNIRLWVLVDGRNVTFGETIPSDTMICQVGFPSSVGRTASDGSGAGAGWPL
jgi:hypothetical protein